jgi:hypothetical protein
MIISPLSILSPLGDSSGSRNWTQRLYDSFAGPTINSSKWIVTNPNTDVATFEQVNGELIMNTLFASNANNYANNVKSTDSRSLGCWMFTSAAIVNYYASGNKCRVGLMDATFQNGIEFYRNVADYTVLSFSIIQAGAIKYTFTSSLIEFGQFKITIDESHNIKVYSRVNDAWVQIGTTQTYTLGNLSLFMSSGTASWGAKTTLSEVYISSSDITQVPNLSSLGIDIRSTGAIPDGTTDCSTAIAAALSTGGDIIFKDGTFLIRAATSIPSNRTVYIRNAKIKMADDVYDPFFRNSDFTGGNANITITGQGSAVLLCDAWSHRDVGVTPNASDYHTYGGLTPPGVIQPNMYKYYGLAFCNVDVFNISGLTFSDYMHWNTILQNATNGIIKDIYFNFKQINVAFNADGINFMWGCNNIDVSNLRGCTGDDFIGFCTGRQTVVGFNITNYYQGTIHHITLSNLFLYRTPERGIAWSVEKDVAVHDITFNNVRIHYSTFHTIITTIAVLNALPDKEDFYNILYNNLTVDSLNDIYGEAVLKNTLNCEHVSFVNLVNNTGKPNVVNTATSRYDFSVNGVWEPLATFVSAAVSDADRNKIVLNYDLVLDETSVPAITDFTPSGSKTVSNVAIDGAGKKITLTVNSDYAYGDSITISYTKGSNPVQGLLMGMAANLSNQAVTNNIVISYDARALEVFANKLSADGVAYADARKAAINTAIVALKAADLFENQFDVFVVPRGVGAGGRKLNWIKDAHNAVAIGALTETDDVGFQSNGSTTALNSKFKPSTQGVKYIKNDACFVVKLSGTINTAKGHGACDASYNDASYLYSTSTKINESAAYGMAVREVGYYNASRFSSTLDRIMVNASSTDKTMTSSAITAYELYMLCINVGGTAGYHCASTEVLEFYAYGKALTQVKFNTLQTIMNAYFAAL